MSRHFLVTDKKYSTDSAGVREPAIHARCDGTLVPRDIERGLWACLECERVGLLQHLPTWVRQRERDLPRPYGPEPPSDPLQWQQYLDAYFSRGVLMVGANDDADCSVMDNSFTAISDKVHVEAVDDEVHLVVFRFDVGVPQRMRRVQEMRQIAPGVLIVVRDGLHPVRLQAHVTVDERGRVKAQRVWPGL